MRHYISLKYRTKFEVEGVGEYEIVVTNIVNTKTFAERQIIPSIMSVANI